MIPQLPPRKQALPPPRRIPQLPPRQSNVTEFQVNPTFENEEEMNKWIDDNIKGAVVVSVWTVVRFACRVRFARDPKKVSLITIEKKGTRKKV